MRTCCLVMAACWLAGGPVATADPPRAGGGGIPADFPRFVVPGEEKPMESLRALYHLHYAPAGPLATMWDEWMVDPTLWPAVATGGRMEELRRRWRQALSERRFDAEGYVASHQHASIAHQDGWPFPFWMQGMPGMWGWHFSLKGLSPSWHGTQENTQEGWSVRGGVDRGISEGAWNIDLTEAGAAVETPPLQFAADRSPFMQLRWRAKGLRGDPFIEWLREGDVDYGADRQFYFPPARDGQGVVCTMIPVHRSPAWKGTIRRLRIRFDNSPGASVGIQALFNQFDTRHNINNLAYVRGCCRYFRWTRDLDFLRDNAGRIRLAMLYAMTELGGRDQKCIVTPYVGHCGRSGFDVGPDGRKIVHAGRGIGHNYWDLLPMGHRDAYATIRYYDALRELADLEADIAAHPEWSIPGGPLRQSPQWLCEHAAEVKAHAGRLFWDAAAGRFVAGIDVEGKSHDYGFTFLNLDAIYYDFATPEQARSILAWICGERQVAGDTSQGKDIYHWRFGPRATTRRNIEWYFWAWNGPEAIPWGGQVQDGGAVLGFSYHDLMARLKVRGPDDAWARLEEIVQWFEEVQAAGGYRAYYRDGTRGTLQGGGTAGGLGCDREFFESILVPQIVIDGFLGFRPTADGCAINPRLPREWPSLTVTRIHLHRWVLDVTADSGGITVLPVESVDEPIVIRVPAGRWRVSEAGVADRVAADRVRIVLRKGQAARLAREPERRAG